jgi:hypothetical protein
MGVKHVVFVVMALTSLVASVTPTIALELGELQAVPGNYPPYVFHLTIIFSVYEPSDIPAVTVRQPRDVLSLVTNNLLELRLPSLTDVELEVHQGGQTLNRLLLKSELQRARARLETANRAARHQPVVAKDRQAPVAEARPLTSAAGAALDQTLLEHEMQEIRQTMQTLVGRVTPWEGLSTPRWPDEKRDIAPGLTRTLWGGVSIGLALLFIGYIIRRQTSDHQQRQILAASIRRLQGQLMSAERTRQSSQGAQLSEYQPEALRPVSVKRRVRVSQNTRRRIRVRTSRGSYEAIQARAAGPTQIIAQLSQTRRFTPAEVVEALGHLRRELISLQRRLPHASSPQSSPVGSPQDTR